MSPPVLEVSGLTTELRDRHHRSSAPVVHDVTFSVDRGERVAIVGESGSGKTMLALSVMGLLPQAANITAGSVRAGGLELATSEKARRSARGRVIAMVFQDALGALDPVTTIGRQVIAVARKHDASLSRNSARRRAVELLASVGFGDPEAVMASYPHQLSGGMRQRALIASALAGTPDILIADEPTTALDVTVQAQIIDLLHSLATERDMAVIWITHDLGVVATFAQRVLVMYAGRVVESGPVGDVYRSPRHPYTRGLLDCAPRLDDDGTGPLLAIGGQPPDLGSLPAGCAFEPRCTRADTTCRDHSPALVAAGDSAIACHHALDGGR